MKKKNNELMLKGFFIALVIICIGLFIAIIWQDSKIDELEEENEELLLENLCSKGVYTFESYCGYCDKRYYKYEFDDYEDYLYWRDIFADLRMLNKDYCGGSQ